MYFLSKAFILFYLFIIFFFDFVFVCIYNKKKIMTFETKLKKKKYK